MKAKSRSYMQEWQWLKKRPFSLLHYPVVMHEFILLSSIDPSRNRNRAYAITLTTCGLHDHVFMVRQSWGRGDYYKNSKKTYFEDLHQVKKYIRSLLMRRKRHGYTVSLVSSLFPSIDIPGPFSQKTVPMQLSLFQDHSIAA